MFTLKRTGAAVAMLLSIAAVARWGNVTRAQNASQPCPPAQVIPLTTTEPAPAIRVEAPLAEALASRGVAIIAYCAEHMHIAPVFGPGALSASPRVGHVHVSVDDAAWRWADASGNPIILQGLPAGRHRVLIELVNANHQAVASGAVTFQVPGGGATPTRK